MPKFKHNSPKYNYIPNSYIIYTCITANVCITLRYSERTKRSIISVMAEAVFRKHRLTYKRHVYIWRLVSAKHLINSIMTFTWTTMVHFYSRCNMSWSFWMHSNSMIQILADGSKVQYFDWWIWAPLLPMANKCYSQWEKLHNRTQS